MLSVAARDNTVLVSLVNPPPCIRGPKCMPGLSVIPTLKKFERYEKYWW